MRISALADRFQLFGALRHESFRIYFFALVTQVLAFQMFIVTLGWLTFQLTHSPLYLGYVNLVYAVPFVLLTVAGGVAADRMNRQRVIQVSQGISALMVGGFAVVAVMDLAEPWHLLIFAAALGAMQAFDSPARHAIYPALLPDSRDLPSAVALNSVAWQGTRVVGPLVAGFVIAWGGAGASFFVTAVGLSVMAVAMGMVRPLRREQSAGRNVVRDFWDGVVLTCRTPAFRLLMGITFFASLFVVGFVLQLPAFAEDVLKQGPKGLGYLYTSLGIGGIAGVVAAPLLGQRYPARHLIIFGAVASSSLIVVFALSTSFLLSLAVVLLAGFAGAIFNVAVQVALQTLVPEEFRGRVMGIYILNYPFQSLGAALLGAVATITGISVAVAAGGAATTLFVLGLVVMSPTMRSLEVRSPGSV